MDAKTNLQVKILSLYNNDASPAIEEHPSTKPKTKIVASSSTAFHFNGALCIAAESYLNTLGFLAFF